MHGIRTLAADASSYRRVLFVISFGSNGPMHFELLHAIEAGL